MQRLTTLLVLMGLIVLCPSGRAATPLEFGLAPYISTRTLLAMFKPLASYIERHLERPVMLVTASGLEEFDARLVAKEYDLAIVSPLTARLTQREQSYEPLLRFTAELYGVLLVKADSALQTPRDLIGQRIAFPQRTSATALLGKELLERYGISMAKVEFPHSFQDSVLLGLVQGEYQAALVNSFVVRRASPEQRAQVRSIGQTRKITHLMLVARADMSQTERDSVHSLVTEFMEKTPEGIRFLKDTGLGGVRPPTDAELRNLDPLAAEQKRIWEELRIGQKAPR